MEDYTVKSVDKACTLLDVVGDYPNGITITELARRVDMYKSTVHRLLATLVKHGLIEQDTNGRYKLGYTVLDLGMRLLASIDLRREAYPYLQELAMQSNEVVHLALLERGEIIYIEKVESQNTVRMHSRVGRRVPVNATGLGKAILAFLPQADTRRVVERYGLKRLTEFTETDRHRFLQTLEEVRRQGYAFDVGENELGICCVAAPIFDHTGHVVAALSVSGPSLRLDRDRLQALAPVVADTARQVSERLGNAKHPTTGLE